jgi:hypothetical protein
MSESILTAQCKGNPLSANTICQGNEGKAWCKSATLDVGDTSVLKVEIGFQNKHVPVPDFVLYDSSSTGLITLWIDKNCKIIDRNVTFTNFSAQLVQWLGERFGKRVEDSLPNAIPGC